MSRTCRKPVSSPSDFECGELHHQSCRGRSRGGGCGETSFFKVSFSRFLFTLQNHLSNDARLTRNGRRVMGWRKSRSFTTCTLARRDSLTSDRILWRLLPLALSPVHHPAPTMLPFWPSERASWLLDPASPQSELWAPRHRAEAGRGRLGPTRSILLGSPLSASD